MLRIAPGRPAISRARSRNARPGPTVRSRATSRRGPFTTVRIVRPGDNANGERTIRISSGAFGVGRPGSRSRISRIADAGRRTDAPGSGRGTRVSTWRESNRRAGSRCSHREKSGTCRSSRAWARVRNDICADSPVGGRDRILRGSVPRDQGPGTKKIPTRQGTGTRQGLTRSPSDEDVDVAAISTRGTFGDVADDRTRASRPKGSESARSDARREAKSRVEQLAKAIGNDEIAKRIAAGNATRDQMLAFVAERLGMVRELQVRELALTERGANFDWWRAAGDSHRPGIAEPRPTRWQGPAQAYEEAVQALCRGDLRRGEALLQDAIALEEKTTDEMTDLVDSSEAWRASTLDPGLFAALVAQTPTSGSCAEPTPIKALLDAILSVEQTVPDAPNRKRRRDPWWTLEDDEEEEGKPDGEGG